MIVTLMCANFIIGNIYVNGTPSVKVVQYHRDSGSVIPCRWITSDGIYKEQRLRNLEMELQECKGIFKGKRRKELQGEIEQTKEQVESMKQRLSDFVTSYGYQNVRAFLVEYEKTRAEYTWYRQAASDWEQTYDVLQIGKRTARMVFKRVIPPLRGCRC